MAKAPAFQFYPGDWLRDPVAGCSLAAQGLWLRMLLIAHDGERYGHLSANDQPMPAEAIARRCGCSLKEYAKLLAELDVVNVPRRTESGVIYSKRMVKDEETRINRAAGGEAGAEHGHKGGPYGVLGGRPRKAKGGFDNPPSGGNKPPPSTSSSSSSSPSGVNPPNPPEGGKEVASLNAEEKDPLADALEEITRHSRRETKFQTVLAYLKTHEPPCFPANLFRFKREFWTVCPHAKGKKEWPELGDVKNHISKILMAEPEAAKAPTPIVPELTDAEREAAAEVLRKAIEANKR